MRSFLSSDNRQWMRLTTFALTAIAVTCCFAIAGCQPDVAAKASPLVRPNFDHLPTVEHPEYLHWSRFPIGTQVIRDKTMKNEQGIVQVITTLTLKNIDPSKLIVESQTTVLRDGIKDIKPTQDLEYVARFPLVDGVKLENFELPSPLAKKSGSETIAVLGNDYTADVYEWDGTLESGKVGMKCWRSDEVPGRLIRQEIDYRDADNTLAVETVTSISIPKAKNEQVSPI